MLPLSHTSHWSLHFMKNVKNRRKKGKNKTQSPSDTSPCTHKTISQAFMPASRSPRHRLRSSILVVPTAQQLSPDGCQGEILLSLCTRFTDVSPRTHIPANWREGEKDGETINSQLMSSLAIFCSHPDGDCARRPSLLQLWVLRIGTLSAETCQWVTGTHVHVDLLLFQTPQRPGSRPASRPSLTSLVQELTSCWKKDENK